MQKDIKELINKWSILIFTLFWTVLLSLTYFIHNKFISKALQIPQFLGGLFFLFIGFSLFIFLHTDKKNSSFKNIIINKITGWKVSILLIISTLLYYILYGNDIKAFEDLTNTYILDFTTSLLYHLFLVFICFFSAFLIGDFIHSKLNSAIIESVSKSLISLSLGIFIYLIIFFILAAFHFFMVYIISIIFLLPIVLFYKKTIEYLKKLFIEPINNIEINFLGICSLFIFIFYTVANITNSFRPFPIGFDELSVYMNLPKLIAESHTLVKGGQAYNWSIFMAVGYLFNGDVTYATLLSIVPGILLFVYIYTISSKVSSTSNSLLAAACFYVIPTFFWQSSADAKVDMALCLFVCSIVLLFISSYKNLEKDIVFSFSTFYKSNWFSTIFLLSAFIAAAFGIKYTALFFILSSLITITYLFSNSYSLTFAMFFISFASIILSKIYTFSSITFLDTKEPKILIVISFISAIILIIYHFIKHKLKYISVLFYLSVFGLFTLMFFSPWLLKNYNESKKFEINSLLNGKEEKLSFPEQVVKVDPYSSDIHQDTKLLLTQNSTSTSNVENKYNANSSTGAYEEILRYIGYEPGFVKYASVIFDMCTFKNVNTLPTDIGLFSLVLLPLIFLNVKKEYLYSNIANMSILVLLLTMSIYTVFFGDSPMNLQKYMEDLTKLNLNILPLVKQFYLAIQPFAISLTTLLKPIILLFTKQNTFQSFLIIHILVIILVLINFKQIKQWSFGQQLLLIFIASSFVFWWMLGNAISWYGIAIFGLSMVLYVSLHMNDLRFNNIGSYLIVFIIGIYLLSSLLHRSAGMIATYDYDSKLNKIFLQYAGNGIDEPTALQEVNNAIASSRDELNANPTKKILRIGTYMNYFINDNNNRVFEDNQLDNFNYIYNRYFGVKDMINNTFKKVGVEYILFDLNTGSIDKTPDKSLTSKIQNFYDYISANNGISVVTTDRMVEDPNSKNFMLVQGVKTPVSNSIYGTRVLKPGSIVLLKIN